MSQSQSTAEQRRNQIVEAAIKVILQKGFSASSMNDIVKASGLSKGGVYHHFASKEDLMIGVLTYFFERYSHGFLDSIDPEDSAYNQIRDLLTGRQELLDELGVYNHLMNDFLSQAPHIPRLQAQFEYQYGFFQQFLTDLIQTGIDKKEFRGDINPKAIASGIMALFDGMGLASRIAPKRVEFPQYAVDSALALLEGIRANT